MTAVLGVACLVAGVLTGVGVGSKLQSSPSSPEPEPTTKRSVISPDPAPLREAPLVADLDAADISEQEPLEELKLVLHSLLTTLTEVADLMQSDSDSYDAELVRRRDELQGSLTLQDMQQLGAVLIQHIDTMHTSNAHYRQQLTTTKVLLKQQQDEVERLQRESGTDFLTNVPNRQAYDERMREMINIARRYGNVFSLLVMDIDKFKSINDDFGHIAGDNVLRDVAQLIKATSRASDFLARYGGEEFAYILPETKLEAAMELAEKLRKQVEDHQFMYVETRIPVTISGGVSQVSPEGDEAPHIFERADAALYRAKEGGRNRIEPGI